MERSAQIAVLTGISAVQSGHIHYQVGGILVLSCALGADYLTVLEHIHTLSAEHGVVVGGGQGVCDVLLIIVLLLALVVLLDGAGRTTLITKRLVKTPKVYFMDTGLAAYLCRWPTAETLENGAMDGAFFGTYVVTEIVKSYYNAGKPVDLFYYRDIDKKEIDLLIVEGDKMYPIEIKKSKEPSNPDKNFGVLQQFKLDVQPGLILCMSDELIPYNRESWYCLVSVL